MVKEWCETCEGVGYIEFPDYDWGESPIEPMKTECYECDGKGYVNTKLCKKTTQRLVGYTVEPIRCEDAVYVVSLYYDDGDLIFETPIEVYYNLRDAMKYCEDRFGYRVDTHESPEVVEVYKLDRYACFKIYKIDIE